MGRTEKVEEVEIEACLERDRRAFAQEDTERAARAGGLEERELGLGGRKAIWTPLQARYLPVEPPKDRWLEGRQAECEALR